MLADWLSISLDPAQTTAQQGTIPGGRYCIEGAGIISLTPDQLGEDARAVVLSVGIHGNETAPIELLGQCLTRLAIDANRLGTPLLVILGNPEATRRNTRFIDTNLNRLFRRDLEQQGAEANRARELMAAVDRFYHRHPRLARLHYDLHTAIRDSHYPRFVVDPFAQSPTEEQQWHWLAGAGIQAALKQHQHSWTFSHYSKHYHQAQAFTFELGKARPFGHNDLGSLTAMGALLDALIAGRSPEAGDGRELIGFQVAIEVFRESEDFRLCFADDTANFTEFGCGETVAEDASAGATVVGDTPLRVVFPNAGVELGARAALLVEPTPLITPLSPGCAPPGKA